MRSTTAVLLAVPGVGTGVLRIQDQVDLGCRRGQSRQVAGSIITGDGRQTGAGRPAYGPYEYERWSRRSSSGYADFIRRSTVTDGNRFARDHEAGGSGVSSCHEPRGLERVFRADRPRNPTELLDKYGGMGHNSPG